MHKDILDRLEIIEKRQNDVYHTLQAELAGINTQLDHILQCVGESKERYLDLEESLISFHQAVDYIHDILDSIDEISFTNNPEERNGEH